ncbi:unnamed protein product [Tilletia laevis]|uniref:Ig-like domain-containing protein n=3 Tax=Tilletia TaxID=13289 RepID=A0ABN7IXA6_9BASI|nr:unnamed protein product [Tilletia controversa]CAD6932140.1 unnamed protein product [Tilletia laevis]CAD6935689.1 unnamed protein product [Tilletia caries]CAD7064965.1 unnamed protein product [Tilletia caries]
MLKVKAVIGLLGWSAVSLTVASLVVLMAASLTIRILQRRTDRVDSKLADTNTESVAVGGFVIPARVYHARFLPKESAHAFRYPSLYLALELGALERKQENNARHSLDISHLLKYKDPGQDTHPWTVSSVNPPEYYRPEYSALKEPLKSRVENSIRLKTLYELRHRELISRGPQDISNPSDEDAFKLDDEIGQIWSITMPSLFGIQGINPLTTYFCYRPGPDSAQPRGKLAFVLLEVHNTFSERHLYVLECGVNEDSHAASSDKKDTGGARQIRRQGCDHQWTFPRTFHVSPFNDRGGFYSCSVKDLIPASSDRPVLDIRVTLLIPDPDEASGTGNEEAKEVGLVKKMVAILTSHPTPADGKLNALRPLPLNANNFTLALLRQPLDLFLTFGRIAYEAGRLHWGKNRLDVFGKPEMDDEAGLDSTLDFDGVGWPPSLNPTEPNRDHAGIDDQIPYSKQKSGALMRSAASASDHCGQKAFEVLLRTSGKASLVSVDLGEDSGANGQQSGDNKAQVVLYARSAAVYSDLLLYPPFLAHAIGSRIARRWGVNDVHSFLKVFPESAAPTQTTASVSTAARWARSIRAAHVRWGLSVVPLSTTDDASLQRHVQGIEDRFLAAATGPHPFEETSVATAVSQWSVVGHLLSLHLIARAEELAFRLIGARYVREMEPWSEVRRAVELLAREETERTEKKEGRGSSEKTTEPSWFHIGSSRREQTP